VYNDTTVFDFLTVCIQLAHFIILLGLVFTKSPPAFPDMEKAAVESDHIEKKDLSAVTTLKKSE
jgi:hypothetical protein